MFTTLKDILQSHYRTNMRNLYIAHQWTVCAGKELGKKTAVAGIRENTLYIAAINHTWACHLTQMKGELLQRLNSRIAPLKVKDIRFRATYPFQEPQDSPEEKNIIVSLDDREKEFARETAGQIQDEVLRRQVQTVIEEDLKWQKEKLLNGGKQCVYCGERASSDMRKQYRCRKCARYYKTTPQNP